MPGLSSRPLSLPAAGALVLLALVLAACSGAPSYEGGPGKDEPYAIVQPGENVKLWTVDGKPAWNRDGETFVRPGTHKLTFRIDFPIEDESQHPFAYIDQTISIDEGQRCRFVVKEEFEKGPPYTLDQKLTRIKGY